MIARRALNFNTSDGFATRELGELCRGAEGASFLYHLRVFLVCWEYGGGLKYLEESLPALNGAK